MNINKDKKYLSYKRLYYLIFQTNSLTVFYSILIKHTLSSLYIRQEEKLAFYIFLFEDLKDTFKQFCHFKAFVPSIKCWIFLFHSLNYI